MKKLLSLFLLAFLLPFSSFSSGSTNDLASVLAVLDRWADQYPQCYQDVADIKQAISELQNLTGVVISEISAFHGDFANLHGELGPRLTSPTVVEPASKSCSSSTSSKEMRGATYIFFDMNIFLFIIFYKITPKYALFIHIKGLYYCYDLQNYNFIPTLNTKIQNTNHFLTLINFSFLQAHT